MLFSIFYLLLILILYFTGNEIPSLNQIIIYWIFSGVILPTWIFILGFVAWLFNRKRRLKIYNSPPLNKIDSMGFTNHLKNEHTKWYFTEEIKAGFLGGFFTELDFKENDSKKISFKAFIEFEKFEALKHNRLKNKNIILDSNTISKEYKLKRLKSVSFNELKNELNEFIRLVKVEGIKPSEIAMHNTDYN